MNDKSDKPLDAVLYDSVQMTRPLARHITAAVEAGLAGTGVSVGMRAVLEMVHRNGPMTIPEMAQRLQLKRQFVHRMTGEAMTAGLLETLPNPSHRRSHFFQVTSSGRAVIQEIRASETQHLRAFLGQVSKADVEAHARIQKALNLFFSGASTNALADGRENGESTVTGRSSVDIG